MKAVVHVHQALAKKKDPCEHPAIIIRTYQRSTHHRKVTLDGPVTLTHSPQPDSCGATITITCDTDQIKECDPAWSRL
jgi:hypothetical protein